MIKRRPLRSAEGRGANPKPKDASPECRYCEQLRHENARHRLSDVAKREQMQSQYARELDRRDSQLAQVQAELAVYQSGIVQP
jgi:hypothetical protein